ncbi:hypothetical protein Q0Z83_016840 [Actinoplanes sichuanensis]|uniref:Uncharacterized protein n=1 Tax=Actinoplanes sichuanensis TaxID=512349 RepID=A0ABW4A8B9_9ACTN|nr:hypothetical protein [Actinoplanes sichuanensis]BEL03493.1 hypothetical protein Q0Z83_016840 [Actinoplanes sichuanensis]
MRGRSSWSRLTMAAAFGLVILATGALPGIGPGLLAVCTGSGCGWAEFLNSRTDTRSCRRHPRGLRKFATSGMEITPDCQTCGKRLPSFRYAREENTLSRLRCAQHGGG